ncbi:MAG TPA: hypothetical protein VFK05_38090 [Polyangiaceae bacterium]|nr:hypothetical protein [Polyangiaceae bacterium]
MKLRKWNFWVVLAVGCNGKLSMIDEARTDATGGAGGARSEVPIRIAGVAGIEAGGGGRGSDAEGGGAGDSAGMAVPIDAGQLGQPCIPSGRAPELEADSANAMLQTIGRCNDGLSCTASRNCVMETDCQRNDDLCVVQRAQFDEDVYNDPNNYWRTGITALAASESHVYWLEYGTRDALGQYLHDGALMSYGIADGTTTVVATGVDAPMGLGVTTTHAYIAGEAQMFRVPLSGGTPEPIPRQAGGFTLSFTSAGDQAFWNSGTGVWTMSSISDAVATQFLSAGLALAADATDLYYVAEDFRIMRTPIFSAAPEVVSGAVAPSAIALHGDSLYALDYTLPDGETFLLRLAKSGGELERLRPLAPATPKKLQVVGDRYFAELSYYNLDIDREEVWIATASFRDDAPPVRLVARVPPRPLFEFAWVGTEEALYFADARTLHRQPLSSH